MQIFHFSYKRYEKILYLCDVFFIVLDLRLSRLGLQRYPFFNVITSHFPSNSLIFALIFLEYPSFLKKIAKKFPKYLVEPKISRTFATA